MVYDANILLCSASFQRLCLFIDLKEKLFKSTTTLTEMPLISLIQSCKDLVISLVITLFPLHLSFASDPKWDGHSFKREWKKK